MRRICWLNWVEQKQMFGAQREWIQELQCPDSIACEFRTKTLNSNSHFKWFIKLSPPE